MKLSLSEVAEKLNAELVGDGSVQIVGVSSMDLAGADEISFITDAAHGKKLSAAKAAAILVGQRIDSANIRQLVVKNVKASLIDALNLFAPKLTAASGIHPTAVIEDSAEIGAGAAIGPGAYISYGARIGAGCYIGPGCVVGENSVIGNNTRLEANVVVYHNCRIGNNCVIKANATIGGDGFGYYFIEGQHKHIPHNGGVIIEDCVDIGSSTCIDRAKFGNTVIGAGTKIDNCVQVAHNVVIGKCCLVAGQVGLAGSCNIGDGVVLAGRAGTSDHITVGPGAMIGTGAIAVKDVPAGRKCWGTPATELRAYLRSLSIFNRLGQMDREVKLLLEKVEKLEASGDNRQ